jgi:hypothetical protein
MTRAGSNAAANARATAALLGAFSEGKNVASAQKALRLSGTRARRLMTPLKADLAELVSQGQSPRYAAVLLGWPARAGVVVWEAICRDVGESVLP